MLCPLLSEGVWEQLSHVLSGRAGGAAPVLGEMGAQGMSPKASSYHGERHPVDLVLIFGFVLPERAVPVERRERNIR